MLVHDALPVRDRRGHSPRAAKRRFARTATAQVQPGVAKRLLVTVCLLSGFAAYLPAHERGTTPITWNREISRLVYDKCASCHRPDGSAFSLMTYQDVQPRLVEIKEAVLSRRMPPWGAVKGFGGLSKRPITHPGAIGADHRLDQKTTPRRGN